MIHWQLGLEHRECGVQGVSSRTHETTQRGRYGGGQALEQGRGQRGRDVEAGRQTLETLEAGGEAETSTRRQTRQSRGAIDKRGQTSGLLTRLGLGMKLHQPRNIWPLEENVTLVTRIIIIIISHSPLWRLLQQLQPQLPQLRAQWLS